MLENEEQEELLNTLAEAPEEEVRTIAEDIYVIGVESLNGQAGDLTLKSINSENLVGEGDIALQTPLTQDQLIAVNSGIDSAKVEQIATNATAITTLQNTKQDNLTQAQLNAVNSGIDATKVAQIATNSDNITSNTERITTIEGKIPSSASSNNKLTDKSYVDNAIATNTANYISDNGQPFQSYADLVAYSGPLTNNDYAFVETIDQAGNDVYTRYKYNASQNQWAAEYTITNPYFTSDQWASINSGIAANDVTQIGTNKTDIATLQTSKQDTLTTVQQAAVDSGIDSTKVTQIANNTNNITALQTSKQDKLTAGANVTISGTTISATDTTYTAGEGLDLTGTEFSVVEPAPEGFFSDTNDTQISEGTSLTIQTTAAPLNEAQLLGNAIQDGEPTPDAPVDIQVVTGEQTLKVTGKNLWGGFSSDYSKTSSQVAFVNKADGSITANGTASGLAISLFSGEAISENRIKTLPAGNYVLSGATEAVRLEVVNSDGQAITSTSGTSGGFKAFTLDAKTDIFVRAAMPSGAVANNVTICPMIEYGSTRTDYQPYQSQSYPLSLGSLELCKIGDYQDYIRKSTGKNLFDKDNANTLNAYFTTGTTTITTAATGTTETIVFIPCNPSTTYTVSKKAGTVFTIGTTDVLPVIGTQVNNIVGGNSATHLTVTTGPNSKFIVARVYRSTTDTITQQEMLDSVQIELGSATEYESYGEVWYKHKSIEKIASYSGEAIPGDYISTTGQLTTGATVYYALATPTDEEITNETLISQLNALSKATTYYGTTNVTSTATSPNLAAILSIESFKNNIHGIVSGAEKQTVATIDERLGGLSLTALTQAEYDALTTKDANTLYIIKADS